jgi:hypothetical protein
VRAGAARLDRPLPPRLAQTIGDSRNQRIPHVSLPLRGLSPFCRGLSPSPIRCRGVSRSALSRYGPLENRV